MNTQQRMKSAFAAFALVGAVALAGCGGGSTSDTTVAGMGSTVATEGISFEGMWARTSPMATTMGAAYVTITSAAGDELVGVTVDPGVAAMAQIHETVAATAPSMSSGMGSATTMAPAMTMQQVDKLDLPAGTAVEMKPGGYHIMLMNLAEPLETGSTITLTLKFRDAGEKSVEFPVMEDAPSGS